MRPVHLVLVAVATATLGACAMIERNPGADPAAAALAGAGKGAAVGAPFGPWGELGGGLLGAIVGAAGAYHIGHKNGRQVAQDLLAAGSAIAAGGDDPPAPKVAGAAP